MILLVDMACGNALHVPQKNLPPRIKGDKNIAQKAAIARKNHPM
jgi:hypothetical protein